MMSDIERAIQSLQNIVQYWCCRQTEVDAAKLAIQALQEKSERENGCEYCDDDFEFWQAEIGGSLPDVIFCPMCGRKLI